MTFSDALKTRDFALTGQLNLAGAPDADSLLRQGETLGTAVDAVQLLDAKQPHISGLAAAALLIGNGVDPVVHMNCRDRNRLALQKDLLGAAALGVTSVLIARGAKIPKSARVGVRNVFDTPALEFMAYIQGLKQDEDENRLAPDFLIGANAEMFGPEPDWVPKNLIRKCDAGANFVQLQICFDMDVARRYMARIVAAKLTHRASFIMGLSPLPSAEGRGLDPGERQGRPGPGFHRPAPGAGFRPGERGSGHLRGAAQGGRRHPRRIRRQPADAGKPRNGSGGNRGVGAALVR